MSTFRWRTHFLLVVSSAAIGCSSDEKLTVACDLIGYPAIKLHIIDAATGGFVNAGSTVTATVNDQPVGPITQSSPTQPTALIIGGGPGTYKIHIERAGYVMENRTLEVLSANECHKPQLVDLTVLLIPTP